MSPTMSALLPENSRRSVRGMRRHVIAIALDPVGQRHRVTLPSRSLGRPTQPLDAGAIPWQTVGRMGVVGTDRIPRIAEQGGAAQLRTPFAADPDRRTPQAPPACVAPTTP